MEVVLASEGGNRLNARRGAFQLCDKALTKQKMDGYCSEYEFKYLVRIAAASPKVKARLGSCVRCVMVPRLGK